MSTDDVVRAPLQTADVVVTYMQQTAWQDECSAVSEEEFRQRAALVAESQRVYSSIVYRFVTLLETEAQRWEVSQRGGSVRSARSASEGRPSRAASAKEFSPTGRSGHFFLSANKLDHTDQRLAPPPSYLHSSVSPMRATKVATVELSATYQNRRREYTVRKLETELQHQLRVVQDFKKREAMRVAAFQRREASLLERALENERKNTGAAVDVSNLAVKVFDDGKPLRVHVEEQREAARVQQKERLLAKQARARASQFMSVETNGYVAKTKELFEERMSELQDAAATAHRQAQEALAASQGQLSSLLIERNIKQSQYKRVYKKIVCATLDKKKRSDYSDIAHVVAGKHPEPVGASVSWPVASPSVRLADSVLQKHQGKTSSTIRSTPHLSAASYARFCGPREAAVLSAADGTGDNHLDPISQEMLRSTLVRGAMHVVWR